MKAIRQFLVAATLVGASTVAMAADKVVSYTIDPTHSFVHFSWNHFGFSTPSADFTELKGSIVGNFDNPAKSSVEVSMPVASLDTNVAALNKHLIEGGDFFKAKEYPFVTFKSSAVQNVDADKKHFQLLGNLTINGITKPVVMNATLNKAGAHPMLAGAEAAGFNAKTTIKRSDFDMAKFAPMVSDDLDVSITIEAVEAKAWAAAQEKNKAAAK